MSGKIVVLGLLLVALIGGGAMYYLQVYAFYFDVETPAGIDVYGAGGSVAIVPAAFRGIDATSSPIRYRSCFELGPIAPDLAAALVAYPDPAPPVAPGWFDCFDAQAIGSDLETGAAVAVLGAQMGNGIDRVLALYPDGHGFGWNEINGCYLAEIENEDPPSGCVDGAEPALPDGPPPIVPFATFFAAP